MEKDAKKEFQVEAIEFLLEKIETDILKLKEEAKETVANSINIIAINPRQGVYRDISTTTSDQLDKNVLRYKELILDINNKRKIHNYVKNNRADYQFFFDNWVERENIEMNTLNDYIKVNFEKKELKKDKE